MLRAGLKAMILMVLCAVVSLPIYAVDVGDSMDAMMLDYATFNRASTPAEATKALVKMRADTVAAREGIPARLEGEAANSPKLRSYRAEMDKLIVQIDKTKALSASGHLPEAKIEGKKLLQLRTEGHKLFR